MIIKIINQGRENGAAAVNYLLSEAKHATYKPVLICGNSETTKQIISNTSRVQKYTSGVISFAKDEDLNEAQKHELISHFQKTFAPYDDPSRVNFLWVEHRDKGRLELHFLCPKTDLKTGKAFNISPPGKKNQAFFNHFVRLQNAKYGFEQVDKKPVSRQSLAASVKQLKLSIDERKSYIENVIDAHKSPVRRKKALPNLQSKFLFDKFYSLIKHYQRQTKTVNLARQSAKLHENIAYKLNKMQAENQQQSSGPAMLDFGDGQVRLTKVNLK
jgi:hypothetical protein